MSNKRYYDALHEAAHAVADGVTGRHTISARLFDKPQPQTGAVGETESYGGTRDAVAEIAADLAGEMAERTAGGPPGGGSDDVRQCVKRIIDDPKLHGREKYIVALAAIKAREILNTRWSAVLRMATALCEKGELDVAETRQLSRPRRYLIQVPAWPPATKSAGEFADGTRLVKGGRLAGWQVK